MIFLICYFDKTFMLLSSNIINNNNCCGVNMNNNTDTLLKIIKLGCPQFFEGGFLLFSIGSLLPVLFDAEFILTNYFINECKI
jgi:hypothetical protein